MVMSWGTGLPEELLFLVKENRDDRALHWLSLSSSSLLFIPPPLSSSLSLFALHLSSHSTSSAPLNQHPHFSCFLIPLLLLHIPSYFHLFVSLSKDSVNQIESRGETFALQEDGWALAPAVGMSWGLRTGYVNTHTHSQTLLHFYPPISAFYVSVISIHCLAVFYYINNNLCSNSL